MAVKDTGIGIKLEDQPKLFKQFGFLDATREINTNGIGLGLHISKCLVNQFEGEVSFVSEYKVGSTFTFSFRLSKAQSDQSYVRRIKNPNMGVEIEPIGSILQNEDVGEIRNTTEVDIELEDIEPDLIIQGYQKGQPSQ